MNMGPRDYDDLRALAHAMRKDVEHWEKMTEDHVLVREALAKIASLCEAVEKTAQHMVEVLEHAKDGPRTVHTWKDCGGGAQ